MTFDSVIEDLRRVLTTGVRPVCLGSRDVLLALRVVGSRARALDEALPLAFAVEEVILEAIAALGDGPEGRAASLLFGTSPESRGRPLRVRRQLAADELDLLPSTFRKNYEDVILVDLATELWRLELRQTLSDQAGPEVPPKFP